ncbi:DUF541 domain-containing protein [Candidatus Parcubacteria bacterium]|jgi:uncharacterized protein YggE|nr:MAG: DUF541 domain-containing protein [Candidatus Parcubacteria bacterium]
MENKMKQYTLMSVGVAALILSIASWSYANTYSKTIEPGSFRSFSVSGEGKVVAVPDVAKFSFSVITQGGKNLGDLQKQNIEKMNKAITYIKDQGVADKDIKTESFNVDPRYQYYGCKDGGSCPPAEIVGYTVTQSVGVKVRDFEKAGDILSGVVQNGANNVSGLQFTIDDPSSVMAKAREQAIEKAKEKAEQIADAGGFSVGRLLGISEGGYQPVYDSYLRNAKVSMAESLGGGAPAPSIEAGSQDVVVNISLQYEIK